MPRYQQPGNNDPGQRQIPPQLLNQNYMAPPQAQPFYPSLPPNYSHNMGIPSPNGLPHPSPNGLPHPAFFNNQYRPPQLPSPMMPGMSTQQHIAAQDMRGFAPQPHPQPVPQQLYPPTSLSIDIEPTPIGPGAIRVNNNNNNAESIYPAREAGDNSFFPQEKQNIYNDYDISPRPLPPEYNEKKSETKETSETVLPASEPVSEETPQNSKSLPQRMHEKTKSAKTPRCKKKGTRGRHRDNETKIVRPPETPQGRPRVRRCESEEDVTHVEFVSIESRVRRRRAIPQVELVFKSDQEAHRITNPLLAMVPANFRKTQNDLQTQFQKQEDWNRKIVGKTTNSNDSDDDDDEASQRIQYRSVKATGTIPPEEFLNSASLVFHRPDTFPLSFLARLLGFDVDIPEEEDFPVFPSALPDPKTLPLRKDTVFLTIPPEGNHFYYKPLDAKQLGDADDQRILDSIDPVYKTFLQHGWTKTRSNPSKRTDSLKFIAKQNQQEAVRSKVTKMAQELLGLSSDWTFQDWGSFQSRAQREGNETNAAAATTDETTEAPASTPSHPNRSRVNYHKYHGPLWKINGKETFRHLPKHIFGILASFKGEPVAILKYQFHWYKLPQSNTENDNPSEGEESELVVLIQGIAYRATEVADETTEMPTDGETQTAGTDRSESAAKSKEAVQQDQKIQTEDRQETMQKREEETKPLDSSNTSSSSLVENVLNQDGEQKASPTASSIEEPTDEVKLVMLALALEHTRACGIFYGVWETPESFVGLNERCFRMVKLRRNESVETAQQVSNNSSTENTTSNENVNNEPFKADASESTPLQPMICDLKKCSSRLAILRFKEQKEDESDSKRSVVEAREKRSFAANPTPERLLVEMPTFEKAHGFYGGDKTNAVSRYSKRGTDQELARMKIFTGAEDATRDIVLKIRAKIGPDLEEKLKVSRLNSQTGSYEEIWQISKSKESINKTKDGESTPTEVEKVEITESVTNKVIDSHDAENQDQISWRVMRCFPIEDNIASEEDISKKTEPDNEVLIELKRKQDELVAIEKSLEPQVRGILAEAINERLEYELPETRLRQKERDETMMKFEDYLMKRKELEQVRQERREEDMDAVCSICNDGEVTPDNQILFCEACNVAVHQICYGVEKIPEGDYYCIACRHYKRDEKIQSLSETSRLTARANLPPLPVDCELCTVKKGAFTRVNTMTSDSNVDDAKWVHMTCAKWNGLNFVTRGDASLVEDVTQFKQYYRRKNISCCICKGMRGAYIQCRHDGCKNWCHITCAIESGICEVVHGEDVEGNPVDFNPWSVLCPNHSKVKKQPENIKTIESLIENAKSFPEEPMPPPLPQELGPYNKLTGEQRKVALGVREYEDKYMANILKTRLAGVRCEVCDVIEDIHGRNLSRCEDCGSVVCHSCELFSNNPGQSKFNCRGCLYKGDEIPQCSMCHQKGGILVEASSSPMTKFGKWKKNPVKFENSLFRKARWAHVLCAFWLPKVSICHDTKTFKLSEVIASNGYHFIMHQNRCGLCGKRGGYKAKCAAGRCHAHGEMNKPYFFHVTCARQIGFEVAHDDDSDEFYVHCYVHGSNENNLRARLEDLIETEKKRAGKDFSRSNYPMKFSDGSKLLHGAIMVMRILGWAWRWAEWWVDHGSTWEPLLEPGQDESKMTARELRIVESSRESRMNDARKCRLAPFGAALRNRNYDTEDGFNTKALERALRAILHTRSLVGPLEEHEIDFFVDILGRAYRSKSRLLGFGKDKIPVERDVFCLHLEDGSPKFELGERSLPGNSALPPGRVFEDTVSEPDDYLKNEKGEINASLLPEIDYKYKGSCQDSDEETTGATNVLTAILDTNLLDRDNSYILKQRRGRIPKQMQLSITITIDGHSISDGIDDGDQDEANIRSQKRQKMGRQYKFAETMMNFDQNGFGPMSPLKIEFLVYVGMKSVDEFMKTTTKDITQQYSDWRKIKKLPPLKDSQSAGNTLNKWKSDVRKYYSQFIGRDESAPEETVSISNEEKVASSNKNEAFSEDMETKPNVPPTADEGVESTRSSKRSRRESSRDDEAVESTRPSRRARRDFGNQNTAIHCEENPSDEIEIPSRRNRSSFSAGNQDQNPPVEVSKGVLESFETRSSPRKTMVKREGMYTEVDDDILETDSETEILEPSDRTAGQSQNSQATSTNTEETDESSKPIQKKRRGRPPNLLKRLPEDAIDFLKMVGISSAGEFLESSTASLAKSYAKFRKKRGQPVLKTTGAASKVSTWKRIVRDTAENAGYTDIAGMGFNGQGSGTVEINLETSDDENGEDDAGDDNDECEICGKRGDLLICDGCEKSYHLHCVDLKDVPEGNWYCSLCDDTDKCVICKDGGTLILCDGCESSYHIKCAGLNEVPEGDWFCSKCKK